MKINYNSACDLERFEKFKGVAMTLSECRKLARLFSVIIKEMPNIIPTSSVSIFVITPNMILQKQLVAFSLILQKSVLDGKFIDVIGPSDATMADPQFKKFKDAAQLIRTNEFMTHPIFDVEGDLALNVQLIARRKKNSKFAAGFTNFDEVFLQIFASNIQAKLHQVLASMAQKRT